jgi:hypothetical protein
MAGEETREFEDSWIQSVARSSKTQILLRNPCIVHETNKAVVVSPSRQPERRLTSLRCMQCCIWLTGVQARRAVQALLGCSKANGADKQS